MTTPVPRSVSIPARLVASIAARVVLVLTLALGFTSSAASAAPSVRSVSPKTLQLEAGGEPATVTLAGEGLADVRGIRVLRKGRTVRDLRFEVKASNRTLRIELRAERSANGEYALEVPVGRRIVSVPVTVGPATTAKQAASRTREATGKQSEPDRTERERTRAVVTEKRVAERNPARQSSDRERATRKPPRETTRKPPRETTRKPARKSTGRDELVVADTLVLADDGPFYFEAPCGDGRRFEEWPLSGPDSGWTVGEHSYFQDRVEISLCAKPGWQSYAWSIADVDPEESLSRVSLARASSRRATLVVDLPADLKNSTHIDHPHVRVGLTVNASDPLPAMIAAGGPSAATRTRRVAVQFVDLPRPRIDSFRIRKYQPGVDTSERIENVGILDRTGVHEDSLGPGDGEVWIEGRELAKPGVEIFAYVPGDYESRIHPEILSTSGSDAQTTVHARFPRMVTGELAARAEGRSWSRVDVERLRYSVMSLQELLTAAGDVSVVMGDPVGTASIQVGAETTDVELSPYTNAVMSLELNDFRSTQVSVETLDDPSFAEAVVELALVFETAGRELVGSALGGNVALTGDLTSPTLRILVGLERDASGDVRGKGIQVDFDAGISLTAAGVTVDLELVKAWVLREVNSAVRNTLEAQDFAGDLARQVTAYKDGPFVGGGALRGLHVMSNGRLFFDLADAP